ncbi:uncharacterized protein RHO17_008643 [Thomomys bottae]
MRNGDVRQEQSARSPRAWRRRMEKPCARAARSPARVAPSCACVANWVEAFRPSRRCARPTRLAVNSEASGSCADSPQPLHPRVGLRLLRPPLSPLRFSLAHNRSPALFAVPGTAASQPLRTVPSVLAVVRAPTRW